MRCDRIWGFNNNTSKRILDKLLVRGQGSAPLLGSLQRNILSLIWQSVSLHEREGTLKKRRKLKKQREEIREREERTPVYFATLVAFNAHNGGVASGRSP